MDFEFDAQVVYWRGPAPWHFVPIPEDWSGEIKDRLQEFTFGWGMIPGIVTIGGTRWYTAFFEKDGVYMIPVKAAVRRRERLDVDDVVHATVEVLRAEAYRTAMLDPALRLE